ncbi:MAG: peroxiredoxin [Acidimicrobiales bacterium]
MSGPGVGDPAPDFSLAGSGGGTFHLAEQREGPTVLVFYPGDDTPVCTLQLKAYDRDLAEFSDLGATLWAISPQSMESHDGFSGKHGFGFPLLADEDKATFKLYGCLGPLGFPRRSVFVIDRDGIVRYAHRSGAGLTFRKTPELVEAVKAAL